MSQVPSRWRRLTCQTLTLSMMLMGLTVLQMPQARAAADALVSGTVVDSVTKQPLESVTVMDATSGRSVRSAVNGSYSLSLPAGDHVLTATLVGYVPSSTPTVALGDGQRLLAQGFTLQQYASASGTVTEKGTTNGVAAVVVKFFKASTQTPNPEYMAMSGPGGSWSTSRIVPGEYTVQLDASSTEFLGEWYENVSGPDTATVVTITAGERKPISAALSRRTSAASSATASASSATRATVTAQGLGSIAGRVVIDPGSLSATKGLVMADPWGPTVEGMTVSTTIAPDGTYSFPDLPSGYYRLHAQSDIAEPYLSGYFEGENWAMAAFVWVGDGAVLTGRDIHLAQPATVSGHVTQRGLPVVGAVVSIMGANRYSTSVTLADGSFQFTDVEPGSKRLSAEFDGQDWWYGPAVDGGGSDFTVRPADHLTGYDIAMTPRYSLSGTVRTAGGTVVPNPKVSATNGTRTWVVQGDAAGSYSLDLGAGTYEVGVENESGKVIWSPGSTDPAPITLGSDTVMDITIPVGRAITLTIRGSDGSVPPPVNVLAYNARNELFVAGLSANGGVTLSLPPGVFSLEISDPSYRPWSTHIAVTSAMTVPVTLQIGGRIEGNVGEAATVTAINVVTGERISSESPQGSYVLGGLPPGDYVVTAGRYSLTTMCAAAWLGGATYLTARRLHIDDGTVLTANDFTMTCEQSLVLTGRIDGHIALPPPVTAGAYDSVQMVIATTQHSFTATPGSDGSFGYDVLPGTYEITAYQPDLALEGHATVMVERGKTSIVAINLTRKGLVSGRVIGPHGEPAWAAISNGEIEVVADADGAFSLGGISYGTHTLAVSSQGVYGRTFVEVTVGPGADVTGLIITLQLIGTIRGWLSPDYGSVTVAVMDAAGRVVISSEFTNVFFLSGESEGPFLVRFSGAKIVTEWWRDAPDAASATPVVVTGGGVYEMSPTLSLRTPQTTVVKGTVTFAGHPLAGVTIDTIVGSQHVGTTTAADGTYSLSVMRGSTYAVLASFCFGPSTYACLGYSYSESRSITANDSTVAGVDFVFPEPPSSFTSSPQPAITGTPVSGGTLVASVGAWTPTPDTTSWQWYADGYPVYGATGSTLLLDDGQVGTRIHVVVTRTKTGYESLAVASAATEPVVLQGTVDVAGAIHSLTPSRLLDSRTGLAFQGPARNGTTITLPVWGRGGVPSGASAVLVNLTVTAPTASGFLTAYASGSGTPGVSNANFTAGATSANLSLVPIGADGAISLTTSIPGSVHVIADVQGYVSGGVVTAEGAVVTVTPTRLLDTRSSGRISAGGAVSLQVSGVGGVPVGATAVFVNLTVTGPGAAGFLTAFPEGVSRPTASNVNFVAHQTVPNMAIVKIGLGKSIAIVNSAAAPIDIVVDVQGYVTAGTARMPGTVRAVTPTRAVDTRIGVGAVGPVPASSGPVVGLADGSGLASLPQGALINLTVTEPAAPGWLAAYPPGVARPEVSNLNFTAGKVVPNLSLATLRDGSAVLFNGSPGTVQVVADVLAYVLA